MNVQLKPFVPLCDAIAKLFYPHVEVVMHDLHSKTLAHIVNPFSKRRAGNAMLNDLKDLEVLKEDMVGPYTKKGADGRPLKSVSTIVRNLEGEAIGLVCLNFNTQEFKALESVLQSFFQTPMQEKTPELFFSQDIQSHVEEAIQKFLTNKQLSLASLSAKEKKELVFFLEQEGVFSMRNVMGYVTQAIGVSRASIYNWLKAR